MRLTKTKQANNQAWRGATWKLLILPSPSCGYVSGWPLLQHQPLSFNHQQ
jgi:hypothetical protein